MVNAVHDVLQRALTRRSQDNALNARTSQMLAQTLSVTPYAGVIHQQCVFDAVLGVVDFFRVFGVNQW